MDINKLRTLVFEKTGIRIDTHDPVFALVALNEAVLAECIEQHVDKLRQAADALREQSRDLTAAGERYHRALQELAAATQAGGTVPVASVLEKAGGAQPGKLTLPTAHWLLGAIAVAVLSAALTIVGGRLL